MITLKDIESFLNRPLIRSYDVFAFPFTRGDRTFILNFNIESQEVIITGGTFGKLEEVYRGVLTDLSELTGIVEYEIMNRLKDEE